MNYQWKYKDFDSSAALALQQKLKIHPTICNLLVQRGVLTFEQAKVFFRMDLQQLHRPFLMRDMDKAVARVEEAINKQENILIYGDYDVDGTTSVALVFSFFHQLYDNISFYIPDRHKEGYGISIAGIDYAEEHQFSLIIALDCGITALKQVEYASSKNIDFILCDHHTPGKSIPEAIAVLNPKREDCIYPYKELSGCGIGFKLCQAYVEKNNLDFSLLLNFIDFVAVSIACDIVPITGENRVLAYFGLDKLNNSPNNGLKTIVDILKLERDFTISDVVFKIGPRINAAGRIAHASKAVEVLLAQTDVSFLQEKNIERQGLDKEITLEALEGLVGENENTKTTVVYQPDWHKGVVGIVASRLIETYYKPTIVLCKSNGELTGSVRSVEGYNVYNALLKCTHLLEKFGGHAYAAGLSLKEENLEKFKQCFEEAVTTTITENQLIRKLDIDANLEVADLDFNFWNIIKQMAPFGPQNMKPVFCFKNMTDTGYSKIVGENHLQLRVKDAKGNKIKGIAFQMADKLSLLQTGVVDIAFTIEENIWNGNTNLEMMVKDIVLSEN